MNNAPETVKPEDIDAATASLSSLMDFIRWGASCFGRADLFYGHGTDNAWDEAVALVLQSLELQPDVHPGVMNAKLTPAEKQRLAGRIAARVNERKPLAYLTHKAYFSGLEFYIDERVLVPRSPVAELIEQGFTPWLVPDDVDNVLDLCCGSGCIGIACAYGFPAARVDVSDLSGDALAVAAINRDRHHLADRLEVVQSDLFEALAGRRYDLIVSNPPYVDAEDLADMPAEFHHEPPLGLGSGEDGLDITRRILQQARQYLTDDGILVVEVGNSAAALADAWPNVPFTWLEFERGGHGVFLLTAADLDAYADCF